MKKEYKTSLSNAVNLFKIFGKEQPLVLVLKGLLVVFNVSMNFLFLALTRDINQSIVDRLTPLETVLLVVINLAVIRIVSRIINEICIFLSEILMKKMNFKLERMKLRKCMNMKIQAYDDPETYNKMKIADRMGSKVITNYCVALFSIISSVVTVIPSVVIMTRYSYILPLFILAGTVPTLMIYRLQNINEKFEKEIQTVNRRIDYYDNISGRGEFSKEIKIFGIQDYLIDNYNRYYDQYTEKRYETDKKLNKRGALLNMFDRVVFGILPTLLLIFLVWQGKFGVADFIYINGIFGMCAGAWDGVLAFIYKHELSESRIKDYFEFMNLPLDLRKGEDVPKEWHEKMPDIEFRNVSFSYPNSDGFMIRNLNFKIKSGEKLALIGLNGAGKSTLIKLIVGLYEPTDGEILFDGENVLKFSQQSVYSLFSTVFQDYIKYQLPLYETLTLGCGEKTPEEIRSALRAVEGEQLLDEKFGGDLNANVGKALREDGIELSGGEHQKLVIARAILQDRPMIILDEPTSNLDAYAETAIIEKTVVAGGDKGAIFVTHRLSVSKFVDKIMVMENGAVTEAGTHDELMARRGKYAELYSVQAERF